MKDLKKIAVLNDLSGMGKCSLTAAIPVISVMGVQACPLPTAVLSNQTGYASYFWDDYTDRMEAIMDEWQKREFKPDGIYTGFLAGEAQAEKILAFFDRFCGKETLVLVDPVLGDQGHTYGIYTVGLCERMRELARRAQVITPNLTEALLLLYGKVEMEERWEKLSTLNGREYLEEIENIAGLLEERFSLRAAVITGVDYLEDVEHLYNGNARQVSGGQIRKVQESANVQENSNDQQDVKNQPDGNDRESGNNLQIGNLVWENGRCSWVFSRKYGGSYSGTGDLFASVLSAGLVKGLAMEECVKRAVNFLSKAIHDAVVENQDRNDGVCFETYLYELSDFSAEGRTK